MPTYRTPDRSEANSAGCRAATSAAKPLKAKRIEQAFCAGGLPTFLQGLLVLLGLLPAPPTRLRTHARRRWLLWKNQRTLQTQQNVDRPFAVAVDFLATATTTICARFAGRPNGNEKK
jgi:hypothetical protein